jgi:hypothetical protein
MRTALKGFDFKRGLTALQAAGALPEAGGDGRRAHQLRIDGMKRKLYPIDPDALL